MFHDLWHNVIDFLNICDRNAHLRTCNDALSMSKAHGWYVLCEKLFKNTNIFKQDKYKQLLKSNSAAILQEYKRASWFFFYCCSSTFLLLHCQLKYDTLFFQDKIFKCWSPWTRVDHCKWSNKDIRLDKIYATFSKSYHAEHSQFIHWMGYLKHKLTICVPTHTKTIFRGLSQTTIYDKIRLPLDGYLRVLMSFSIHSQTSISTNIHQVEVQEIV